MLDSLGDRMKSNLENRQRPYLIRRMPVILRVDGRAFHTLTAKLNKPFDNGFMENMVWAAVNTLEEIQGCKLAYVQSDEASFLLTDYDTLTTDAWFDYNQQKMVSITAALMSINFNWERGSNNAVFDCRAFNIPKEEVSNYFLWRVRDWHRNSIFMYARSFFSDTELHQKKQPDIHEMLHGIGKNWAADLSPIERNGTFVNRDRSRRNDISSTFGEVDTLINSLLEVNNAIL